MPPVIVLLLFAFLIIAVVEQLFSFVSPHRLLHDAHFVLSHHLDFLLYLLVILLEILLLLIACSVSAVSNDALLRLKRALL